MIRPHALAPVLCLALSLALAGGCARTALTPACPEGMVERGSACACVSDQGCPADHACNAAGACECRGPSCCPAGYAWDDAGTSCYCTEAACCPADHRWVADAGTLPDAGSEGRCACAAEDCCPDGYAWNPVAQGCACAGEACCPVDHRWDEDAGTCACDGERCCPVDFRWDATARTCVCATDACCPSGYSYVAEFKACICTGDACCPAGYTKDPGRQRCVCMSDASCPAGNRCDAESGACRCLSDNGCQAGQFCNALGFCQSAAACASNLDCLPGTFCDVTRDTCVPDGPCSLDEHCPAGQLCDAVLARCRAGCRRDSDCPQKIACVAGQCTGFCRTNATCAAGEFCNVITGQCAPVSGRTDCADCTLDPATCGFNAQCLSFIAEGQQGTRFCGEGCATSAECPAGFDCTGVIYGCSAEADPCPDDGASPGQVFTCKGFLVENEQGTQFYCSDSAGVPHEYYRACAPSSGFCPATVAP